MITYENGCAKGIKIAYIGGGSRGWAWILMGDLAKQNKLLGEVCLYDINFEAAKLNVQIANNINALPECANNQWKYYAEDNIDRALKDADFVFISVLPGSFDEMASDLHTPNKYNVWQTVGDTTGPGGILRALRTMPIYEGFANKIAEICPNAWIGNFTNPMAMCTSILTATQPALKTFGLCHEVFGTQDLLATALKEETGITARLHEIIVEVTGVNHFTFVTRAMYKNIDLYPIYARFVDKYYDTGYDKGPIDDDHWINKYFKSTHRIKFDLFKNYGVIAAAGDRHLAEFCSGGRYLANEATLEAWGSAITPTSWRKEDMEKKMQRQKKMASGEERFDYEFESGESTVSIMAALLGLGDIVANVNVPNIGQISNAPRGIVVETNAAIRANEMSPSSVGCIPDNILGLTENQFSAQKLILESCQTKSVKPAFYALCNDPLVCNVSYADLRTMYAEMLHNTKKYLTMYDLSF